MPKAKRKPYNPAKAGPQVHDRRATELGRGAQVAPVIIDDPYAAGEKIVISGMTNHQLQTLQDLGSRNKRRGAGASTNDLSQLNSISTFSHVSMNSAQSAEDLEEERRSKETKGG